MLISEKENGEGKTEESSDAGKDNVSFGEMNCSCIPSFVDNIVIISFLLLLEDRKAAQI